jgi:hypothetical protein
MLLHYITGKRDCEGESAQAPYAPPALLAHHKKNALKPSPDESEIVQGRLASTKKDIALAVRFWYNEKTP